MHRDDTEQKEARGARGLSATRSGAALWDSVKPLCSLWLKKSVDDGIGLESELAGR